MSIKKKTNKANFWLVILGLFLAIGFVASGVYLLDDQGFISVGSDMPAERPESADGTIPDFGEGEMTLPPGDHDDAGTINSTAFLSILQMVLQLGLVVIVVTGVQWVYARLVKRLSRALAS